MKAIYYYIEFNSGNAHKWEYYKSESTNARSSLIDVYSDILSNYRDISTWNEISMLTIL